MDFSRLSVLRTGFDVILQAEILTTCCANLTSGKHEILTASSIKLYTNEISKATIRRKSEDVLQSGKCFQTKAVIWIITVK